MNKILGKNALAVLLIIFLCCITFSVGACDPTFSEYSGEYKELYSAAIQSILGVWSDTSDEIFVLEKDEYGRVLYCCCAEQGIWVNGVISLLIAQKYDNNYTYVYSDKNYIVKPVVERQTLTQEIIYLNFEIDEINSLKSKNDWGEPLNFEKMSKIKHVFDKTEDFAEYIETRENIKQAARVVNKDFSMGNTILLTIDNCYKRIYFMRVFEERAEESGENGYTDSYVFMFDDNDSIVGYQKIYDIWNYSEQLAEFKEKYGWNMA